MSMTSIEHCSQMPHAPFFHTRLYLILSCFRKQNAFFIQTDLIVNNIVPRFKTYFLKFSRFKRFGASMYRPQNSPQYLKIRPSRWNKIYIPKEDAQTRKTRNFMDNCQELNTEACNILFSFHLMFFYIIFGLLQCDTLIKLWRLVITSSFQCLRSE